MKISPPPLIWNLPLLFRLFLCSYGHTLTSHQNCLQWGRSNLVDRAGVAENSFTKPRFWEYFVDFSQEKQQNPEFTKFSLPFVQNHSGNNSKIMFLCICICYGIEIMSKTVSICYAPPLEAAKNSCLCICYQKLIRKQFPSVSVSAMKCTINSKIISLCLQCDLDVR